MVLLKVMIVEFAMLGIEDPPRVQYRNSHQSVPEEELKSRDSMSTVSSNGQGVDGTTQNVPQTNQKLIPLPSRPPDTGEAPILSQFSNALPTSCAVIPSMICLSLVRVIISCLHQRSLPRPHADYQSHACKRRVYFRGGW